MKKQKILPIILAVWPYLILLLPLMKGDILMKLFVYGYMAGTAVVYIMNIINAFRYKSETAAKDLAFYNMVIKAVHIPFYLAVFGIGLIFILASVVPALIFFSPFVVITLFTVDIFLMFTSSMYGVSAIIKAAAEGTISKKSAVKNAIMHFVFVLDIISAVNVYKKIKSVNKDV